MSGFLRGSRSRRVVRYGLAAVLSSLGVFGLWATPANAQIDDYESFIEVTPSTRLNDQQSVEVSGELVVADWVYAQRGIVYQCAATLLDDEVGTSLQQISRHCAGGTGAFFSFVDVGTFNYFDEVQRTFVTFTGGREVHCSNTPDEPDEEPCVVALYGEDPSDLELLAVDSITFKAPK